MMGLAGRCFARRAPQSPGRGGRPSVAVFRTTNTSAHLNCIGARRLAKRREPETRNETPEDPTRASTTEATAGNGGVASSPKPFFVVSGAILVASGAIPGGVGSCFGSCHLRGARLPRAPGAEKHAERRALEAQGFAEGRLEVAAVA
eukprot:scaffold15313_cov132-Isochrysis_galbana.AAC.7